jgi:hypothetical protein
MKAMKIADVTQTSKACLKKLILGLGWSSAGKVSVAWS